MGDLDYIPTREDVLAAAERIHGRVHRTPVFSSRSLSRMLGVDAVFKCENFQRVGSFKIRGATNAVLSIVDEASAVATHSSGNHGAAIALAAKEAELACVVVIPQNTRPAKREAIERYGATVVECGNTFDERQRTLQNVIDATGATYIPPFDDARIISGAGTAALELLEECDDLDQIWVPIGGGGLAAGSVLSAEGAVPVLAGEPELARDAKDSLERNELLPPLPPRTIADGLRTSLGRLNFKILREAGTQVALCSEDAISEFVERVAKHMKLVIEPSSAVPLAAIAENRDLARGKVGIILTGGNV